MLQNLPELVLDLVYEHLSYEDVLTLRSTCRDLKCFVDGKQFTKLHLFVEKFPCHHRLFYTGDWICHAHSYHSEDLTIVSSNRFRERFANVRMMTICKRNFYRTTYPRYREDAAAFDLTSLNCFEALSHLEMDEVPSIKGKLNLPELQIASFRISSVLKVYQDYWFELKCPKLKALRLLFYKPVLICETDRLEHLDYCDYCDDQDGAGYLSNISPNLRKLSTICIEPECPEWPLLSLLQSGGLVLPSLSEIQIKLRKLPSLEELDKMANNLRDLKQDARTKHIKVIFIGKLINSSNEISRITSLIQTNLSMAGLETPLNDRSFLFLSRTPELEFLLSATCVVQFNEDIECTEEMIKKLKNVKFLNFTDHFKPSVSTFELFARNCKSLKWLNLRNQTVTGRLLEMLSGYLLDLKGIKILASKYETLKPLVKFKNLEAIGLDFNPPRDELTFIFKNSQNLEQVFLYGKHHLELLRTGPKVHQIFAESYRNPPNFGTLSSMIAYYYENHLFEQPENYETSTSLMKKKRQAKIPDAAVEMPSSYRTVSLNVRFGDFGSDPSKTNDDQITREQESFMNSGQHSMNTGGNDSHSTNSMYLPNLPGNGSMNIQPLGMWPVIQILYNPVVGQSPCILTGMMPFWPGPSAYQPHANSNNRG